MLLSEVLLGLIVLTALLVVGARSYASVHVVAGQRGHAVTIATAAAVSGMFAAAIATRSPNFGIDLQSYLPIFQQFCERHELTDYDTSYVASMWAFDIGMFGACDYRWLPAVSVVLCCGAFLCAAEPIERKLCFVALYFSSLAGFDLSTNTLRQSLSVAAMTLAWSFWSRSRLLSIILAVGSLVFHGSAPLILLSVVAASLGWRRFALIYVVVISFIVYSIQSGLTIFLIAPLISEISIFLAHESDELLVRIAAIGSLVAIVASPLVIARHAGRMAAFSSEYFQTSLRLFLCCLPSMFIPYFGYRFVYGLFPIILFTIVSGVGQDRRDLARWFPVILTMNLALLLVWSDATIYFRTTSFYD